VPYSQHYNVIIVIHCTQLSVSDKTNELSHQFLNITSFKRQKTVTIFVTPDADDVFFFVDNQVFIVPNSQQYINTLLKTLGKSIFSCGQIYINI